MYFGIFLLYIYLNFFYKMKHRLFYLIKTYAWFLFIFILQKPIFMIRHYDLYRNVPLSDWFDVMYHGLPLDFSLSAYILVIPVFVTLLTVWVQGRWSELVSRVYFDMWYRTIFILGFSYGCNPIVLFEFSFRRSS